MHPAYGWGLEKGLSISLSCWELPTDARETCQMYNFPLLETCCIFSYFGPFACLVPKQSCRDPLLQLVSSSIPAKCKLLLLPISCSVTLAHQLPNIRYWQEMHCRVYFFWPILVCSITWTLLKNIQNNYSPKKKCLGIELTCRGYSRTVKNLKVHS